MAALVRYFRLSTRIQFNKLISSNISISEPCQYAQTGTSKPTSLYFYDARRKKSFFTTLMADQLWKGVTSVSNAGKKRGRGKGSARKLAKDLNRGQVIGVGEKNIIWPGLTAPIIKGNELIVQKELPPDVDRLEKLIKVRNEMGRFRRLKLSPLERGWSGGRMAGRSIGPPEPIGEDTFENFDTKILEMRRVFRMTGNFGRIMRFRLLVVTGNGNGLAGFSTSSNSNVNVALRRAKNKAGQRLRYIERFEDHTVCHDFFTQFSETKIYVSKKPKGFGLVCHRAIREICRMLGITDIYAKIEGPTNTIAVTKAFFLGLQKQKTMEELAHEMGLHLVEFRREHDYYPRVIASPAKCRTSSQIPANEITDYHEIVNEGRVVQWRPPFEPFYKKLPTYQLHIKKSHYRRNHTKILVEIHAEYGDAKSFLTIREEQRLKAKEAAALQESSGSS